MKQIQHWIDGSLTTGVSSRVGPVFNPASGVQTGEVALANGGDVDEAVRSAKEAFESWRNSALTQRQNVMFAFREIMSARRQEMAETLTAEHGKTVDDALGEVQRGIEVIEFACNIAHLLKGDYSEQVSELTPTPSDSRWGLLPESHRSTSRRWSRCGCTRSRSPAATPSS